jgi:hypothetical protein
VGRPLQLGNTKVDEINLADLCGRFRAGQLSLLGPAPRGIDVPVDFPPDAKIESGGVEDDLQ